MATNPQGPWAAFDHEQNEFFRLLRSAGRRDGLLRFLQRRPQNESVESLLLHMRTLVDILRSRGRPDDIKLSDLLPKFSPSTLGQLQSAYGQDTVPGDVCYEINKLAMHATTKRSDRHDYTSLVSKLAPPLIQCLQEVEKERQKRRIHVDPRLSTRIVSADPQGRNLIQGHYGTEWGN